LADIKMKRYLTNIMLCSSMFCSLLASAADSVPYTIIAGSSFIGTRENSKQNVHIGFSSVFNEMLSSENIKCEFRDFDSSEELAEALKKNQINSMFGSPLEFIKSESLLMSSPLVSGVISNQQKSKILLLVRKDSEISAIEQLKNKKIASQKWVIQDLGGLYLDTLLLEKKLPTADIYFSEIIKTQTSNAALVSLFFKKADVALLSESEFNIAAELNPQMRAQTRILIASEPYLVIVAALTKNTPADQTNAIKKNLLSIENTSKGKNILRLMKMDGLREINLTDLNNVRELVEKNKQLKVANNAK